MKLDVTNKTVREVQRLLDKLSEKYEQAYLKSMGTKKGRRTFILFFGRKKKR